MRYHIILGPLALRGLKAAADTRHVYSKAGAGATFWMVGVVASAIHAKPYRMLNRGIRFGGRSQGG